MTPALLDTSVIVRYLTGDPPRLAARAAKIIDSDQPLALTDVVIAETAYVLSTVYGVGRADIVEALVEFLQRANISTLHLDKDLAIQGLLLCRPSRRVSFADAMVWAAARSSSATAVFSFDERFPSDGLTVHNSLPAE